VKVSTKGLYGTLAVLDLAVHYATGHVHKADIAARQGIPEQYLAQLLSILRRAGYVKSVRGPAGGHILNRAPSEISVGEIVELLDGPQITRLKNPSAEQTSKTVIQNLLYEADEAAAKVLYSLTFDKVVEQLRKHEGTLDFII